MVTSQVDDEAEQELQAPPHEAREEVESGAAVRLTETPAENEAEQVDPQLMPDGLLDTIPPPVPEDLLTVSVLGI
jgi:hypothetical protein